MRKTLYQHAFPCMSSRQVGQQEFLRGESPERKLEIREVKAVASRGNNYAPHIGLYVTISGTG